MEGQFYDFRFYEVVHEIYELQVCFDYSCDCRTDNTCPVPILEMEFNTAQIQFDEVSRREV